MSPGRRDGWLASTGAAVLLALIGQIAFFAVDLRVPHDPARHLPELASLHHDLEVGAALARTGGWYELLVAVALRTWRDPAAVQVVLIGWTALLLVGVAGTARHLGGWRAAFASTALAAAVPPTLLLGRHLWVHVPEAALLLVLAWALAADPRLSQWRTALVWAVGGVLVLRLRESGLVWCGAALPSLLLAARGGGWPRLGAILLAWGAAAAATLFGAGTYLRAKGIGHDAGSPLLWLLDQIPQTTGLLPGLVLALGLVALAARARRPGPTGLLLAAWAVVPLLLLLLFRAGSLDFPHLGPVLAVGGGLGLARAGAPALAALPLAVALVGPWLPSPLRAPALTLWGAPVLAPPTDLRVAQRTFGGRTVERLLDASCPASGPCRVVAPFGLFHPLTSDELGRTELLQLGRDEVELQALGDLRLGEIRRHPPDAVAVWDCPTIERDWLGKHPDLLVRVADEVEPLGWPVQEEVEIDGCRFLWLAPGEGEPWSAEPFRERNEAFLQREPGLRGRTHLPRVEHRRR